jgi:hypothetical protein
MIKMMKIIAFNIFKIKIYCIEKVSIRFIIKFFN